MCSVLSLLGIWLKIKMWIFLGKTSNSSINWVYYFQNAKLVWGGSEQHCLDDLSRTSLRHLYYSWISLAHLSPAVFEYISSLVITEATDLWFGPWVRLLKSKFIIIMLFRGKYLFKRGIWDSYRLTYSSHSATVFYSQCCCFWLCEAQRYWESDNMICLCSPSLLHQPCWD